MTSMFWIDPLEVLGITPEATLAEIQTAYRAKSKIHHPDVGGETWAFRVLARSYELACTARVIGRASEELRRAPRDPSIRRPGRAYPSPPPRKTRRPAPASGIETSRPNA